MWIVCDRSRSIHLILTRFCSQFTSYNVTSPPSSAAPPIVSPPPFGVNSTAGGSTDCAIVGRNVTTTANTTCSAVAQQFSVGVDSVFDTNPFLVGSSDCSIPAQTTLCLLKTCTTYTVKTNDTCISVAAGAGAITGTNITSTQLQSFNPDLGIYCQLMSFKVGQTICLTPNGGFPNIGVASNGNPSATPTVKAALPTPTVSGTTSNCGRYYQVQVGDVCNSVVLNNTISLPDFLTLNPEIDDACSNLWLGYYYCVAPFPPLTTTSAIPVITATANATSGTVFSYPIPTANYTQSFVTQTFAPAGVPAPTNVAVGTKTAACGFYYNVTTGDTIQSITTSYALNASTLITWNPELQSGNLTVGTAICVLFPTGNYTLPPAPVPANVAANTTASLCAEYYTVQSGDSCPAIEVKFFIANSDFLKLNPSINTACTNIIAGVAYCVLSVNPPGTATTPTGPPTNVAPGTITSGCTQYYTVVSGDSCGAIETKFTISDTLLHAMNPELSTSCTNIIAGDAYCVATSNTTAPTNVATGTITSGCIQYYTIASGDSCGVIETMFNVTDSLFHTMNPEINTGCTNILLGEAYCVKTTNTTTAPPTGPPSNLATGSLTNCTTYYTVASGDSCSTIDANFKIAFADFLRWNPEVNTACTNIFGAEAYCVGGGGNPCPKIYTVVSGDFCSKIQTSQSISNATMYSLNPWLDHNCDLNVGQNICV